MSNMTADLHIMADLTIEHRGFPSTPEHLEPFHTIRIRSGGNTINLFFHGPAYDAQLYQAFQPTTWAAAKEQI